jgi:hypothetical protein
MDTNKGGLLAMGKQIHNKHFGGLENLDMLMLEKNIRVTIEQLQRVIQKGSRKEFSSELLISIRNLARLCDIVDLNAHHDENGKEIKHDKTKN